MAFMLYRMIVAVFCLTWLLLDVAQSSSLTWLLYLSNWAFLFLTLYFILAAILSIHYNMSEGDAIRESVKAVGGYGYHLERPIKKTYIRGITSSSDSLTSDEEEKDYSFPTYDDDRLAWYHKVSWVIYTIASVNSLVTSVFFWSMVHREQGINGRTITFHILNSGFMLLDTVLSHIPVQLLHVLYSHVFLAVYVSFTVIYWAIGGRNEHGQRYIYDALDYQKKPGVAVFTVFLLILICQPASHLVFYALVRVRRWLVIKINETW